MVVNSLVVDIFCIEFIGMYCIDWDIDVYFWLLCFGFYLVIICVCYFEIVVMYVDWMIGYCEVVDMYLYLVIF